MRLVGYGNLMEVVYMTGADIRKKIDANNTEIQNRMKKNRFVLDSVIFELSSEISKLQTECPHEFINSSCIYCDKEE